MSAELVLAEQVQWWVERVAPGRRLLAEAAVAEALISFAAGASVSEACEEARRLVESRLGRPSPGLASVPRRLAAAS
jgi:hypothetical protein